MHDIQKALLSTIQEKGIKELPPLRKLADLIGKKISAQQVKHHLFQLEKKGFISIDQKDRTIKLLFSTHSKPSDSKIISLPVFGAVNCGPALNLAEGIPESYMKISSKALVGLSAKDLFVVRASGDSMNNALIDKKNIEDGDYLIIDQSKKNFTGKGEVVLSIIDGAANIKKVYKDGNNLMLVSDSFKDYPPIYIDSSDEYFINGQVIQVIKKPMKSL